MRKCTNCPNEISSLYSFRRLCNSCDEKRRRKEMIGSIIAVVIALSLIAGVRLVWAKLVYDDMRCFLAECRINK